MRTSLSWLGVRLGTSSVPSETRDCTEEGMWLENDNECCVGVAGVMAWCRAATTCHSFYCDPPATRLLVTELEAAAIAPTRPICDLRKWEFGARAHMYEAHMYEVNEYLLSRSFICQLKKGN